MLSPMFTRLIYMKDLVRVLNFDTILNKQTIIKNLKKQNNLQIKISINWVIWVRFLTNISIDCYKNSFVSGNEKSCIMIINRPSYLKVSEF